MKTISLLQPWASLIALGEKRIETRSWKTNYRGPLLIHASAKIPKWAKVLCQDFAKLIGIEKYEGSWLYYLEHGVGPFGKIIAKCDLVDVVQCVSTEIYGVKIPKYKLTEKEEAFGDYTPGRYAWILEDIEMLPEPIPAKGQLGLWEYPRKEE